MSVVQKRVKREGKLGGIVMDKNCGTCKLSTLCIGEDIEEVAKGLVACCTCGNVYIRYNIVSPNFKPAIDGTGVSRFKVLDANPRTNKVDLCDSMRGVLVGGWAAKLYKWKCSGCEDGENRDYEKELWDL